MWPSLRLRHLLADNDGVPSLGVDPRSDRQAAARYRVGVLLLGHYAVFDDLRGWRRHLTAHWGRRWRLSRCRWRLLGCAADQQQEQNEPQVFHRKSSSSTHTL